MACMKLGSKSEVFHLDGDTQTWFCSSGLPSDVTIEVQDMSFHLHKFPLLSRSKTLETLIADASTDEKPPCVVGLHDLPGGPKAFLLVAKFCYGVKLEVKPSNVVPLRCAAEYLQMTEEYGDGNLVALTESFLDADVLAGWADTLWALQSCDDADVGPHAEDLGIVSRCVDSLARKACGSEPWRFGWPVAAAAVDNPFSAPVWNGIQPPTGQDWWFEDVSSLKLPLFKRFVLAVGSRAVDQETIAGCVVFYAKKHLPLLGRPSIVGLGGPEAGQKTLLEEIVGLLPGRKRAVPTKLLLRLLRTSMILGCGPSCRESLERRIGPQLDEASVEDVLIPNVGYSSDTLYEIDCVQRILDHFMEAEERNASEISEPGRLDDDDGFMGNARSLTPMTLVANLVDGYLAEVASDVNLKTEKFRCLAATVPDYARPIDDGMYRAIDIYLKAHPWLTDTDRELLCRLMDCQKLSLEGCTHAAQNERLPLRFIVQVLFFEQLRLRTSVAGCLYVSDNYNSQLYLNSTTALAAEGGADRQDGADDRRIVAVDDMRGRVNELERECVTMKKEIDRLVKARGVSWNRLCKIFGLGLRVKSKAPSNDCIGGGGGSSGGGCCKKVSPFSSSREW